MVDSISDILHKRDYSAPPEIELLKSFIRREFDSESDISLSGNKIIITADSAALASTLQMNLPKLKAAAETDKKIVIRIV